jgi:tetratricopeptide (TPR) repeat protein
MSSVAQPTGSLETAMAHALRLLDSEPALAAEQAGEILKAAPGHPAATRLLAAAHSARGHIDKAIDLLTPLVRAHPEAVLARFDLGVALARKGRSQDAIATLRQVLAANPDIPQGWRLLADVLFSSGDRADADAAYMQHIRQSTRNPDLLRIGQAVHENHIAEAEAMLRAHLKRAPTDVVAIRMLAEVAERLGRHEDAENLLERCLELAPSFHAARQNYALILHRANKPTEALAQLEHLLKLDPANLGHRNLKAAILCRIGEYTPAIAIYADILAIQPKQAKIWLSYGHALKTAGEQDRSIEAYRRSLELDPGFGEAWWSLANLKTVRFGADDVQAMRDQLQRDDLTTEHRFHLQFALAKALEDAEQYAESFQHYLDGNALRRSVILYNADDTTARVKRIKRTYTAEFFKQRAGAGAAAPDPIFVVGLPRSGSTLIEQILSSHSAVEGTMELPEIISMTRLLRRQSDAESTTPYHDVLAGLDLDALRGLGEQYIERTRIQRKTDAPFFIDKMPNNFVHLGLIQLALPNARIIDARRHPLACCLSGFKQHFARGQNFSYGLEDIGRYYHDYVELMAHFDAVLPGRIHRVIYERMVDDTETEVRRLLDYCGLPFEEGCLRFYENDRPVRTASSEQVRKPIYRDGVAHWQHYDAWLAPLKAALGPVLDSYPEPPVFSAGG